MVNPTPGTDTILAVQKMQNYIEANLQRPITLKDLATIAGYSPWHAARLFKEYTGKTPFDYIRALRLSQAALTLRDGNQQVLTVALDFLFATHEGFTRAFSRQFGLAPNAYRRQSPPIQLFMPYKVLEEYRALHQGDTKMTENHLTKTIFVQVVERPARKVLLKRGNKAEDYYAYCEEVGCDVWSMLRSVKEALYEPVGMWLPKHLIPTGTSRYVQGVEVPLDYARVLSKGYELMELPPCKMMIFQGEPYSDEDFEAAITEVWHHIEKFDPTLYGYRWAPETAPRFQMEPLGCRGYIEGLPIEEVR